MKRLMLLAAGLALAAVFGAAGAYFTGQTQIPDSVIKAGTVAVSAEPTSAALSIDALAPGTTVTKPVTVVNDGNLPVSLVVTAVKKAGITDFYEVLTCRVTSDSGELLYDGTMSALRTNPITLPAGQRSALQFAVGLPAEAGNDMAGDYAKLSLYVDAEQVH